jgi:hypothetical protein
MQYLPLVPQALRDIASIEPWQAQHVRIIAGRLLKLKHTKWKGDDRLTISFLRSGVVSDEVYSEPDVAAFLQECIHFEHLFACSAPGVPRTVTCTDLVIAIKKSGLLNQKPWKIGRDDDKLIELMKGVRCVDMQGCSVEDRGTYSEFRDRYGAHLNAHPSLHGKVCLSGKKS